MDEQSNTIVVSGTREAADAIKKEIDTVLNSQSQFVERKTLDGNTPTWIVIATLAVQSLPSIIELAKYYLPRGGIKKIKVGDVEIENPTEEQVDLLIKQTKSPNGGSESD